MRRFALLPLMLVVACSGSEDDVDPATDAGQARDGGVAERDGGPRDAGPRDGGPTYGDAVLAASWTRLENAPQLTRGKQDDIFFTSADHGFAVSGPRAAIYRTENGGETWETVLTHSGTYFRSLLFTTADHGFAGNLGPIAGSSFTDTNVLYETNDGGDTWAPTSSVAIAGPAPTGVCNMTMSSETELVGVGRVMGPSFLLRSHDSGATWTSTDLGSQLQMLIDARFTSATEGLVVGGTASNPMKCTILRTTDGTTFDTVFTSATNDSLCWKISFPSDDVGYVSIQNLGAGAGTFAKTTDGGRTWTELPLGTGPYSTIGIGFITEEIGWVASDNPNLPVLRTTDGGETWTADPSLSAPLNRFRFVDERTAYAIGGSIYKLTIDAP